MSSHREAPSISKDPVADNTDLYAFVDPNDFSKVTIISNFVPLEEPAGGPNFYQFGDDVLYEIMIDNDGDGKEEVTYQFQFKTIINNPDSSLYNTGPISSLTDSNWNIRQVYSVTKVKGDRRNGKATVLGTDIPSPPVRIGPRSTPRPPASPNYLDLVNAALAAGNLPTGEKVFAGQRADGFYVDLGSDFDLATLRPFQALHGIPAPGTTFGPSVGKDGLKGFNVHTIAIQVPKTDLTLGGYNPISITDPRSTIGIWTSASRQKALVREKDAQLVQSGPWVQVSRLGEPLINELIIPVGEKDLWNSLDPVGDAQFLDDYTRPELQNLLPVLYPGVFPTLATTFPPPPASAPTRDDLVAILLTGIPSGIISGFQNFTGSTQADMLRLNLAFNPSYVPSDLLTLPGASPKQFGLLRFFVDSVFDFDGFPNGRRVFDNITAIELRAIAGLTYQLVASYTPDGAAALITDGTTPDVPYMPTFPYLATPHEGYEHFHD